MTVTLWVLGMLAVVGMLVATAAALVGGRHDVSSLLANEQAGLKEQANLQKIAQQGEGVAPSPEALRSLRSLSAGQLRALEQLAKEISKGSVSSGIGCRCDGGSCSGSSGSPTTLLASSASQGSSSGAHSTRSVCVTTTTLPVP